MRTMDLDHLKCALFKWPAETFQQLKSPFLRVRNVTLKDLFSLNTEKRWTRIQLIFLPFKLGRFIRPVYTNHTFYKLQDSLSCIVQKACTFFSFVLFYRNILVNNAILPLMFAYCKFKNYSSPAMLLVLRPLQAYNDHSNVFFMHV